MENRSSSDAAVLKLIWQPEAVSVYLHLSVCLCLCTCCSHLSASDGRVRAERPRLTAMAGSACFPLCSESTDGGYFSHFCLTKKQTNKQQQQKRCASVGRLASGPTAGCELCSARRGHGAAAPAGGEQIKHG